MRTGRVDDDTRSLAQAIERAGSPVELLRNQNWPAFTFPVAPEFTNWRDEQRAWNTTVALMDQSHHMTQLFLDGADLIPLLESISPNTFATFRAGVAKQLISVNKDGYLIGDGILFYNAEGPEGLVLIGHHILIDWVRFNVEKAQAAGKDVRYRLEPNSHMRQGPPTFYRYELQGPHADMVMEKIFGGPAPEIKFFHIGDFTIAGKAGQGAPPRHGRPARLRVLRPVGGQRGRPRGDPRRGRRVRHPPRRREGVLVVAARVGMGADAVPRDLRRRLRRVPRVAARRADRVDRRFAVLRPTSTTTT